MSKANLLLTKEYSGHVQRWREVPLKEWDRTGEFNREILHLKAEQRMAFVVKVRDNE